MSGEEHCHRETIAWQEGNQGTQYPRLFPLPAPHPSLLWSHSLARRRWKLEGGGFWEVEAAGISLPEHRADGEVGREDLEGQTKYPAHLQASRFELQIVHHLLPTGVESLREQGSLPVLFAAVSPVPGTE